MEDKNKEEMTGLKKNYLQKQCGIISTENGIKFKYNKKSFKQPGEVFLKSTKRELQESLRVQTVLKNKASHTKY